MSDIIANLGIVLGITLILLGVIGSFFLSVKRKSIVRKKITDDEFLKNFTRVELVKYFNEVLMIRIHSMGEVRYLTYVYRETLSIHIHPNIQEGLKLIADETSYKVMGKYYEDVIFVLESKFNTNEENFEVNREWER